ncbi:hypothetical protein [Buchnera aphidicola]|uniref:hypothetical protein n=1 Tax=Buchnera aphidicola TaxID=9 RepID=UPI003463D40F
MQIFKNYKKYLQFIIITFQIINLFLITSCTLKDFKKDNILFDKKHPLKILTVPKGITIPDEDQAYKIPYNDKDLEKKKYNIFPPL